jgi:hypothetical protein
MSLNGIQTGIQTSVEVVSMQFSSSSQTNGCRANQRLQFNDQQLQDVFNRLSQAFNSNGCAPNEAQSPDCQEGSNPLKGLLEKLVNILKSLKEQQAGGNQAQTPQTGGNEDGGGNFLEKLLTAPLDMAKSLIGGIFGGGGSGGGLLGGLFGGGGGGGLLGGIFGGIFGGK